MEIHSDVIGNYQRTMAAFEEARLLAGRQTDDVCLVAVSKTYPAERVEAAYRLGHRHFGENYAQELVEKWTALPKDIAWHYIGRLQRNKVKYIIDKVAMIHSVDSPALAREISRQALLKSVEVTVLVQVNLRDEDAKAGFVREGLRDGLEAMAQLPGLRLAGLMTIGPYYEAPEDARQLFQEMRALRDEAASWAIPGVDMRYLSMGMSHDFTVAIAEGADFVRVGSAIFGQRS